MGKFSVFLEDETILSLEASHNTTCDELVSACIAKCSRLKSASSLAIFIRSTSGSASQFEYQLGKRDYPLQILEKNVDRGQGIMFIVKSGELPEEFPSQGPESSRIIDLWNHSDIFNEDENALDMKGSESISIDQFGSLKETQDEADMFGYLMTGGRDVKMRYFVLQDGQLYIHRNHKSRKQIMKPIEVCLSSMRPLDYQKNLSMLTTPTKRYKLGASSRNVLAAWFVGFHKSCIEDSLLFDSFSQLQNDIELVEQVIVTEREKVATKITNFRSLIELEGAKSHLLEYLKSIHCEENIMFHNAVEQYKKGEIDEHFIFYTYLEQGSPFEIALQSSIRDGIQERIETPDPEKTVFDEAQEIVLSLMENNVFPEFTSSVEFLKSQLSVNVSKNSLEFHTFPLSYESRILQFLYSSLLDAIDRNNARRAQSTIPKADHQKSSLFRRKISSKKDTKNSLPLFK